MISEEKPTPNSGCDWMQEKTQPQLLLEEIIPKDKVAENAFEFAYALAKDALVACEKELSAEREAAKKLCEIYFNIAAEAVGEDEVRRKRDAAITTERDKVRPAIFDPEHYPEDRITQLEQQLAAERNEHGRITANLAMQVQDVTHQLTTVRELREIDQKQLDAEQRFLEWVESVGAQLWATRSGYGTKGCGPIKSWTCQVFVTKDEKRVCIQPTCPTLKEAISKAMEAYES